MENQGFNRKPTGNSIGILKFVAVLLYFKSQCKMYLKYLKCRVSKRMKVCHVKSKCECNC